MKLYFKIEKQTPGAVQYKELDANGAKQSVALSTIGTLYLRKSALGGNIPEDVTVELTLE